MPNCKKFNNPSRKAEILAARLEYSSRPPQRNAVLSKSNHGNVIGDRSGNPAGCAIHL
jgi:hypothetical protein